ncbi:MAG: 50S ribosomal protein L6 [Magnetococcales bacterium]|nr:50S ribosomal protein L6 [Magnetococcales bacterium]
MSRVGKKPIPVPSGVDVKVEQQTVSVKGKRGSLTRTFHPDVEVHLEGGTLHVTPRKNDRAARALWGLTRSLLNNMVRGVSEGFTRQMEIVGVGYRAAVAGRVLKLTLGYSHPIDYNLPDGINAEVEKNTMLTLTGADRERLGQTCAEIRQYRPPEPYKGKGVRYVEETVLRKEGKKK